jgi:hypothetical protein
MIFKEGMNKILSSILFGIFLNMSNAFSFDTLEEINFEKITEKEAEEIYFQAVSSDIGTKELSEKAWTIYDSLQKANPSIANKIKLASLTALKAKFASLFSRAGFVNSSIEQFLSIEKEALSQSDIKIIYEFHLYRGRTFQKLPTIFGQKKVAASDIKTAIELLPKLPAKRPKPELGRLYFAYAQVLKDEGSQILSREMARKAIEFGGLDLREQEEARLMGQ